ncbi:unnamed protein product [Leptidea sinapis]|uniref:Uncharacterized protein n=1 Tax=Leptidea sinapis TaxID=189913 RepID=A0A5E4R0C6_9NEOP|nr:unnamed protein product [Leptidea sinapis]
MFTKARTDGFDSIWRKKTTSLIIVQSSRNSNNILRIIAGEMDGPLMGKLMQRTKSLLVIKY